MDALETIRKRRSVRSFLATPVPREDLEKIVDAARLAATGSNRQPWDFIVVTNRATIDQFKPAGGWITQAPVVIAVVLDPATRWWVEDGAAAIENMLLASTALGYGSCWVEGDALPREAQFKELLGVPENKRLMALIPIGVPQAWPTREKKTLEQVIHWEKY
jgi:nitroreductase